MTLHEIAAKLRDLFVGVEDPIIAEEHNFRQAVADEIEKVRTEFMGEIISLKARIATLEGTTAAPIVAPVETPTVTGATA